MEVTKGKVYSVTLFSYVFHAKKKKVRVERLGTLMKIVTKFAFAFPFLLLEFCDARMHGHEHPCVSGYRKQNKFSFPYSPLLLLSQGHYHSKTEVEPETRDGVRPFMVATYTETQILHSDSYGETHD